MEFPIIIASIASAIPRLVIWTAVIILSAIVLRRSVGRAERFLLAGVILMLVSTLLNIPSPFIVPWFIESGGATNLISSISRGYRILLGIIDMAGIICLIYGFWIKFRTANSLNR